MQWKKYKKSDHHSYSFGAFPTMELIQDQADWIKEIIISTKYRQKDDLVEKLEDEKIPYRISDSQINRLSPKGNIFLMGVFEKRQVPIQKGNHLVCHEISDMGNLGNICRSMLAFGVFDLITIGNSCDFYHPKTVRSSMGAIFQIRHAHYDRMEDYKKDFSENQCQLFMLDEEAQSLARAEVPDRWSLVFGNEGSGLPEDFVQYGIPIMIPQSPYVDSLNLTTAAAIALYEFTSR